MATAAFIWMSAEAIKIFLAISANDNRQLINGLVLWEMYHHYVYRTSHSPAREKGFQKDVVAHRS